MTQIRYDSRGCGLGKTTQGIYKQIDLNLQVYRTPCLVVVPSIQLQKQYFLDLHQKYQICVINSEDTTHSTTRQVLAAMERSEELICITHATFVKLPLTPQRKKYALILDESLDQVISRVELDTQPGGGWNPDLGLSDIFSLPDQSAQWLYQQCVDHDFDLPQTDWYSLTRKTHNLDFLFSDSEIFRSITDHNYVLNVTLAGWHTLVTGSGTATCVLTLNPAVFAGYQCVYVASARFEVTKLYNWMKYSGFTLIPVPDTEFIPHQGEIRIWINHNPGFSWSSYRRQRYPELLREYHRAVNQQIQNQPVLVLRNSAETQRLAVTEHQVSHNVHGMNNLQQYLNVSLESTINPAPAEVSYLKNTWFSELRKSLAQDAIKDQYLAYTFYQVVMRTQLRQNTSTNTEIQVFCMDPKAGCLLIDYFANPQVSELEFDTETTDLRRQQYTEAQQAAKKEARRAQNRKYASQRRAQEKANLLIKRHQLTDNQKE